MASRLSLPVHVLPPTGPGTVPPVPPVGPLLSPASAVYVPRRRLHPLAVLGIVGLHVLALWGLSRIIKVRELLLEAPPLIVSLVLAPSAPTPVLPTPVLPVPRVPTPPVPLPPVAVPVLQQAPASLPAPSVVAAEPQPARPAAITAPAVVFVAPSPPVPPPPLPPPAPPRQLASSALQYLEAPAPVFPRLSKRNGESGRVIVRAFVEAAGGAPRSVQVAQSSGYPRLDEAALAAVQKARFKPTTENGQPVEGWALIPIDFELEAAR
jgi:protein TonB